VPLWAWALAAALAYGAWQHRSATAAAAKAAKAQLEAQAQTLRADGEKRERAKEQTYAETIQTVAGAYGSQLAVDRTDARSARTELDRLRDDIARRPSGACPVSSPASGPDAAGSDGELLGQCAARYSAVADEAQRIKSKLTALQEYERKRQALEQAGP
jgi:hypothetical protein